MEPTGPFESAATAGKRAVGGRRDDWIAGLVRIPRARRLSSMMRGLLLAALTVLAEAHAQVPVSLSPGWNLLGNGGNTPIAASSAFSDASLTATVWKWNRASGRWVFYSPLMGGGDLAAFTQSRGYDVLSGVDSREGFWVYANRAGSISLAGGTPATLSASDLQPGWNLVSGAGGQTPSALNQSLRGDLAAAGRSLVTAWAWEMPSATWRFYSPELEAQGGTALADYIASKGYLAFAGPLEMNQGLWLNVGPLTGTVPGVPVIGSAMAGYGQVAVTFTAPASDGGAPITSYTVTSDPEGITATGAGSPIVVGGLNTGVSYSFTVRATNALGTGAPSGASNSVVPLSLGGTGASGAIVVEGAGATINAYAAVTDTQLPIAGTAVAVDDATGFAPGDEILVVQMQHASQAGTYEFNSIASIAGSLITLARPLTNGYTSAGGASTTQIIRVPNYTTVTVPEGAAIVAMPWNGSKGGVVVFRAAGLVTVAGAVDVTGQGFRGGAAPFSTISCSQMPVVTSLAGESFAGSGAAFTSANGGGGGAGNSGVCAAHGAVSGGGGGYGTAGFKAGVSLPAVAGEGGQPYGTADLSRVSLGSGGGAGGAHDVGAAGAGGAGGGAIMIFADAVTLTGGSLKADGAPGQAGSPYGGSGGGGSGGAIHVSAVGAVNLGAGLVQARGGGGPMGGNGGFGRIRLDGGTVNGTSSPASYPTLLVEGNVNAYTQVTDSSVPPGATGLNVGDASPFVAGDEVLILQMQDSLTAGVWEQNTIVSISGNTIVLAAPLANGYTSGTYNTAGAQATQVVKVARYANDAVIEASSTVSAPAWNGSVGGIVALRVQGNLRVAGTINATALGFRGGTAPFATISCASMPTVTSLAGESFPGSGTAATANNGGGGGAGNSGVCGQMGGVSGGGGGYGTAGVKAVFALPGVPGDGGDAHGMPDLVRIYLGSGGGAGGAHDVGAAAAGGAGGGIIVIFAGSVTIAGGTLQADGAAGGPHNQWGGAGGGGSGGSIYVSVTGAADLGDSRMYARGGNGPMGATGGDGRIRAKGASITGTSLPAFYSGPDAP